MSDQPEKALRDEIMRLRLGGASFNAIGSELGLTKGQVAGVVFRRTSDKYRQQLRRFEVPLIEKRIRLHTERNGAAATKALLARLLRELEPA